jgi:RNA recognition motif-containing protein
LLARKSHLTFYNHRGDLLKLIAGNLSREITEKELRTEFAAFGEVSFINLIWDRFDKTSAGFGIVDMPGDTEATSAIAGLHGKKLKGRELTVNAA